MAKSFQTFLIVGFAAAFVIAIAVFSGLFSSKSSTSSTTPSGQVIIWGVLPREAVQPYLDNLNTTGAGYTMQYTEHDPQNFQQDLIVALANGVQPDLVMFNSEIFSQFKDKLTIIPFNVISERTYRDTYIDGAQVFLTSTGAVGYPLLVDPLVVYYNKDLLAAKNFVTPPATWNDLVQSLPLFVKRNNAGALTQTAIALGTTTNVHNVRDILSALFLQTGNPIVSYDSGLNRYAAVLSQGSSTQSSAQSTSQGGELPTIQALRFYTSFSDPTGSTYAWNRSIPDSQSVFLSGKSVFYIGRASELFSLQSQNPNLNFDVMPLFQSDAGTRAVTFGSFIGISMLKAAPNPTAANLALTLLSQESAVDTFSKAASLAPVRRSLLLAVQQNPYVSVFFKSALNAFSWPDPNPQTTAAIFNAMITNSISGKADPATALYEANQDLQNSIR